MTLRMDIEDQFQSRAEVFSVHRPWFWRVVQDLGYGLVNWAAAHTTYVRKEP